MLRNHYFSGVLFLRRKFANLLPKLLTAWRRVVYQLIFNRFIEFSHLGFNNYWVLSKSFVSWGLLTLKDFCCFTSRFYIVISMLRHIFYIVIFMLRHRHIFYNQKMFQRLLNDVRLNSFKSCFFPKSLWALKSL